MSLFSPSVIVRALDTQKKAMLFCAVIVRSLDTQKKAKL